MSQHDSNRLLFRLALGFVIAITSIAGAWADSDGPEFWQVVPEVPLTFQGQFVTEREALRVIPVNDLRVLRLPVLDRLVIPENSATIALSFARYTAPSELGALFALDQNIVGAKRGDIISCIDNGGVCTSVFSSQDDLGLPDNIMVDALTHHGTPLGLYLSFNASFIWNGMFVDFRDVMFWDSTEQNLTKVFDGRAAGIPDQVNLNGVGTLGGEFAFYSVSSPAIISEETVMPNDIIDLAGNVAFKAIELGGRQMHAFSGIDSGLISFDSISINVLESAGILDIPIIRLEGHEASVSVNVVAIDGTAVSPQDYALNGSTQFVFDDLSQQENLLMLEINNNNVVDGTRSFELRLQEPSEGSSWLRLGSRSLLTVNIIDDDSLEETIFANGFE